jgi:hypothetical protein
VAKRKVPNPHGRAGDPVKVPLPFDAALRAALETPPPPEDAKPKRRTKRKPKAA